MNGKMVVDMRVSTNAIRSMVAESISIQMEASSKENGKMGSRTV